MTAPHQIQPETIVTIVASYHAIARDALAHAGDHRTPQWPLAECVWMLRHLAQLDYAEIGALLGGRSDATIARCLSNVHGRIDAEPAYLRHIQELRTAIFMPSLHRPQDAVDLLAAVRAVMLAPDLSDQQARATTRTILHLAAPMGALIQEN